MILLEWEHGFISSRYVVRFRENDKGGWTVYYQSGADVTITRCTQDQATEYFDALKRQDR